MELKEVRKKLEIILDDFIRHVMAYAYVDNEDEDSSYTYIRTDISFEEVNAYITNIINLFSIKDKKKS